MAQLLSGTRIYGTATVDTQLLINGNIASTNTTSGALQVVGGAGVGGNLYVGGIIYGTFSGNVTTATTIKNGNTGQILFQSAPSVTSFVGAGTAGQLLVSAGSVSTGPVFTNTSSIRVGFATNATTLEGGTLQSLPYQSTTGTTAFLAAGTAGYLLQTNGTGSAPSWANPSNLSIGLINTVADSTNASFYLTFVNSNNATTTGELVYTTSSFTINPSSGNVGLGTNSPAEKLDIQSPGDLKARIYTAGTAITTHAGLTLKTGSYEYLIQNFTTTATSAGVLRFYDVTAGAERMRIANNGYVSIGSTTTISKLTVIDSIAISNATGAQRLLMGNRDAGGVNRPTIIDSADGVLRFGTGTNWSIENGGSITEWLRITVNGGISFAGAAKYGSNGDILVSKGDAPPQWTAVGSLYAGQATTSTQVYTAADSTNISFYPTFVNSNNTTATGELVYTTSSFTINPSTGNVGIAGNVGIGGQSPILAPLHVAAPLSTGVLANVAMFSQNSVVAPTVGQGSRIILSAYNSISRGVAIDGVHESGTNAHYMAFSTSANGSNPAERMRIDSSGNVLIGTTSTRSINGAAYVFEIEGINASTGGMSIIRNQNSTAGSTLNLGKTRGTIPGSVTVVQPGDIIGRLTFNGADGSAFSLSSSINGEVDSSVSGGIVPGRLVFNTTNFLGTFTERMRITSSGGIAFSGPTNYGSIGTYLQSNGDAPPTWIPASNITVNTATNIATGTTAQILYQTAPGLTGFFGPGVAGQILISAGTTSTGPIFFNTSSLIVGYVNNIIGGISGSVPYQSSTSTTSLLAPSTAGYLLQTNGSGASPSWTSPANITAGITAQVETVITTTNLIHYPTLVDSNNNSVSGEKLYTTSSFGINPSTGYVGIGTTSPASSLDVVGNVFVDSLSGANNAAKNSLFFGGDSTVGTQLAAITGYRGANVGEGALLFKTTTGGTLAEKMRILATGAISFGNSGSATGSAGNVLQSQGSGTVPQWVDVAQLTAGNANTVNTIAITSSTSINYYPTFVDSNNAVINGEAIYTSSTFIFNPVTKELGVGGTGRFTTPVSGTTGAVVLRSNAANTATSYIQWTNNASTVQYGVIGVNVLNTMTFATGGTEAMRIEADSTVVVGFSPSKVFGGNLQVLNDINAIGSAATSTPSISAADFNAYDVPTPGNNAVILKKYGASATGNLSLESTITAAGWGEIGGIKTQSGVAFGVDNYVPIIFTTNAKERMRIENTGTVYIIGNTTQSVFPTSNKGIAFSSNFGGTTTADIWNTNNPTTYGNTGIRFLQWKTASTFNDLLFLSNSGAVGFGGTTNVGTAGYILKSNGSGASPSWIDPAGAVVSSSSGQIATSATSVNSYYYPTFVNSNNVTETAESLYTTSSFIINPKNGYVGFGAAPSYKLDIDAGALAATVDSQIIAQRFRVASVNNDYLEISNVRGIAGAAWNQAGWRLQEKIDATWMAYIQFNSTRNGTNDSGISFGTGSSTVNANAVLERMRIDSSGNVGIGSILPRAKVHIRGAGQTTGNLTDGGNRGNMLILSDDNSGTGNGGALTFATSQSDTANSIGFAAIKGFITNGGGNSVGDMIFSTRNALTDTQLTERMRIQADGKVRLQTDLGIDAGSYLYFGREELFLSSGGSNIGGSDWGYITFDNNNTTYGQSTPAPTESSCLRIGTSNDATGINSDNMALEPTGDLYLRPTGTSSAIYVGTYAAKVLKIDMTGTVVANGNITAYGTASDIKLKENVVRLEGSLLKVQQLKGYSFNYIGKDDKLIGVVAQEIEQVVPEVVYEFENTDGETYKAVRYEHLTALLIEAINEQQSIIDQQQKQINQILEMLAKQ